MRIGILGSGLMGGKLGTIWARAGHEVVFSYARSEQKLQELGRHGTPREAVQEADALLLAVHWSRVDDVLRQAGDVSGKVIVTCSLPMNADDTGLVIAHTSSGAEELAKRVPKARVVSAFNTVPSEVLFGVFAARRKVTKPSVVYCGDDASSKKIAARLIRDVGFDPVDAGPLRIARYTEPVALLVAQLAYEGDEGPVREQGIAQNGQFPGSGASILSAAPCGARYTTMFSAGAPLSFRAMWACSPASRYAWPAERTIGAQVGSSDS